MTNDLSKNKRNVPPLRFPEFSGEWEKCKVSELLDFYSTNSLSWEQLEYNTKNILNLHYGLIHIGLPTMVDLTKDKLPNIKNGNKPKNYKLCKEGDIAFADASEDTNEVAKAIEFYNLDGRDAICGLHTIHGRDNKNKTVVGFKGYAFSSTVFHNQIRRIAQGTKIYSISIKNFSECYIGMPPKAEQAKITSLLYLIDERIATQNKIIEDYKKLIGGISLSLFSRHKSNAVLGYICKIIKGSQVNGEDLLDVGQYYVMNGGKIPSGYLNYFNTPSKTISISEGGNSCGYVQYNKEPFWSGGHCYTLQEIKDDVNSQYLFYYLKTKEHAIMTLRVGSGLPNIQKKDIEHFPIYLPTVDNQEHIANMLNSIYQIIENERLILNLYSYQKQYLLSQLFI